MAKEKKPRLTKEGLDARFTAQQEKNRARRETKVTGEDVQKLLADRTTKRPTKVVPGQRARVVSLGLGFALLVGSGVLAVATTNSTDAFAVTTEATQAQIASAKGSLAETPAADTESATHYSAELDAQISEARAKGEDVAKLQQEFAAILFQGNSETSSNGAPTAALRTAVEHRRLLAPYFVPRALLAEDALAYAPVSTDPFDADQIDPRFPWHVGYKQDGRTVRDPAVSRWSLTSVMATSVPGVLEATWLDTSASGDLFAWATASYYVDPGAFGSLTVGSTTLGERNIPSSDKAGA